MDKPTIDGAWITAVIKDLVSSSTENTLNMPTGEKTFDIPLIGFASGTDPLFEQYVAHISEFYLTPLKIFKMKEYSLDTYGIAVSGCGIYQADIPCTSHIPCPDEG
jgi:hypothetical protein